jgi:GNAT superfamily N-acetyltransferase
MENGMKIIQEDKYGKIFEQLNEIPYNTLFARAVLETKVPGRVFVDNESDPKTVLIAHSYGMSLLFGDTENLEFNSSLANYVLNTNSDRLKYEWMQVYPERWNDKLSEILNGKIINFSKIAVEYSQTELDMLAKENRKSHVIQWGRVNFRHKDITKIINVESKYTIKLIDSDIYDRIEGAVVPKHFWKSKEDFLSDGVGYVLMIDNDIISIAFSSCKFENELEIGVETSENHRGMGFAKHVCKVMLAYCKLNGYSPVWACRKENIGSYRLAKSLGFDESLTLAYYELIK